MHRDRETMWPASANVLAIKDSDGISLVDVGCGHEDTYLRLKEFLRSNGFEITDVHTVVLTHAHPDHMGAMGFLLEEIKPRVFLHPVEIPLAADPSRLNHTFGMDIPFRYGLVNMPREQADIIEYFRGLCPMASARATHELRPGEELHLGDYTFLIVETPGHANGLVSLFEAEKGLLFSADAVGEVVAWYAPDSGGLTAFLEALDRLAVLPAKILIPSHGGISRRPGEEIARTKNYLLRREEKIIGLLQQGPIPFRELMRSLFKNPLLHVFPGPQILQCHLDKLAMEGKVLCGGAREDFLVQLMS